MRPSLVALIVSAFWSSASLAAELELLGVFHWDHPAINGISGIEVSADGVDFEAVSDLGWYVTGNFQRGSVTVEGIEITSITPILGVDGLPVAARQVNDWSDSEGLAFAQDGTRVISFERWAHVWSYSDTKEKPIRWIRDHPDFREMKENKQLEAIAVDGSGELFVFPERTVRGYGGFPVYRALPEGWEVTGTITSQGWFRLVGADFASDGLLYLLERRFLPVFGWQSRIRRFETPDGEGEILWTSGMGDYENLEGIAAWQDDKGLRLTLVSDNNRDKNQQTQIVEFRLTE